ncbi:MAG: NAD(P)-dependent oxidoreductase [Flavobacteriales bacterium]|nr:NAD(P)-dependent oxidoreductase [Flavobacteriales bacterium]
MKILVVGAGSAVGKLLVVNLERDHEIIRSSRNGSDLDLDLSDLSKLTVLPPAIDVVVHLAASYGGKLPYQMVEAEKVNVVGTTILLQKAIEAGVNHFVYVSSVSALLTHNSPYWSAYALSKRHAEEMARLMCDTSNTKLTILQPSQLYGETENFRSRQPFLYHVIDRVQSNSDITIQGSSDPQRNFLHVDDLVQVITRVIEKKISGTYSVTHPTDCSFKELSNEAIEAFQSSSKVVFDPEKPDIPDNVFAFDDTLYQLIDFFPSISLKEGMRRIASNRSA